MSQAELKPISQRASTQLEHLVTQYKLKPGRLIEKGAFDHLEPVNMRLVLDNLPKDMSQQDFLDILMLAYMVESATPAFAATINAGAKKHNASWLNSFINIWIDDEQMHADPYEDMLKDAGTSQDTLARIRKESEETTFDQPGGKKPAQRTFYGVLSEKATQGWHHYVANTLRPHSRSGAIRAARVSSREGTHVKWFGELTAVQVEDNPELLGDLAQTALEFVMPGAAIAPELHANVERYMDLMSWNFKHEVAGLIKALHDCTQSPEKMGQLITLHAAQSNEALGPIPIRHIAAVLKHMGSFGYGVVGEAILEKVGLERLIPPPDPTQGHLEKLAFRMRNILRDYVSGQLEFDFKTRTIAGNKGGIRRDKNIQFWSGGDSSRTPSIL